MHCPYFSVSCGRVEASSGSAMTMGRCLSTFRSSALNTGGRGRWGVSRWGHGSLFEDLRGKPGVAGMGERCWWSGLREEPPERNGRG